MLKIYIYRYHPIITALCIKDHIQILSKFSYYCTFIYILFIFCFQGTNEHHQFYYIILPAILTISLTTCIAWILVKMQKMKVRCIV